MVIIVCVFVVLKLEAHGYALAFKTCFLQLSLTLLLHFAVVYCLWVFVVANHSVSSDCMFLEFRCP